ncbi:MAG: hypothetical protein M1389_09565 [Chloroflexi bacterium]|nr:hypothetical protein [Chloroflexota bacterium]
MEQLPDCAGGQNVSLGGLNRPANDPQYTDPRYLAQEVSKLHQQNPGLPSQLLGGGNTGQGDGSLLSSPVAKAALAGSAAMPFKNFTGRRQQGLTGRGPSSLAQ